MNNDTHYVESKVNTDSIDLMIRLDSFKHTETSSFQRKLGT